jgi:hypothetical protein
MSVVTRTLSNGNLTLFGKWHTSAWRRWDAGTPMARSGPPRVRGEDQGARAMPRRISNARNS